MIGEQPVDAVAQQPLLFGEFEIHQASVPSHRSFPRQRGIESGPVSALDPRFAGVTSMCYSPSTAFETMFFMISLVPP